MLEQKIRDQYQYYLISPVLKIIGHKVKPHTCTIFAGMLGIAIIPALYFNYKILSLILLALSGYLDTLDGSIARLQNNESNFGCALDIVTDRLVESSVILGLFLLDPSARSLASMLMLISILLCVTSFLIVGVFSANDSSKSFHYSPGLIERAEAFIFFALMIILPPFFNILALLFSILVTFTTVVRLHEFKMRSSQL